MKKLLSSMLLAGAALVFASTAKAQVKVGININIGDQPDWGPAGYDYAEYYYMPDIETYYYVPEHQFVYFSGNRWVFSSTLPPVYAGYNLYTGYKVVFKTHDAYLQFNNHRVRYVQYKNYEGKQLTIKKKHDQGNHYGQYKNNGKGKGRGKKNR